MKALPIGIENFKEMIDHQYYYVDKTNFIKDVCNEKVALYTRPRRFHRNSVDTFGIRQVAGKPLNMSRRCPPRRAVLFLFDQTKGKRLSV